MAVTNEEKAAHITALLEERAGVVQSGKQDRVDAIDANLRLLGAAGAAPVKRAEKRQKDEEAPKPEPEAEPGA